MKLKIGCLSIDIRWIITEEPRQWKVTRERSLFKEAWRRQQIWGSYTCLSEEMVQAKKGIKQMLPKIAGQ